MCPRQELNLDLELRRFSFYPLNYKDKIKSRPSLFKRSEKATAYKHFTI